MLSFRQYLHYGFNTTALQVAAALRGKESERDIYDTLKEQIKDDYFLRRELDRALTVLKGYRVLHSANMEAEVYFESFREFFKEAMQVAKNAIPLARNEGRDDGKAWWEGFPFFFQEEPSDEETFDRFAQVMSDMQPAQFYNFYASMNKDDGLFIPTALFGKAPTPFQGEMLPDTTNSTEATPNAFLNLLWKFAHGDKAAEVAGMMGVPLPLVVEAGEFYFKLQSTISGVGYAGVATGLGKGGVELKGMDFMNLLPSLADLESAPIRCAHPTPH